MQTITTQELKLLMEESADFTLLDCRSPEAYQYEHLPRAICIPWREVETTASTILPDKDTLIITYCSSLTCDASEKCFNQLKKLGYNNLREYPGGLAEWKAMGYQTTKTES